MNETRTAVIAIGGNALSPPGEHSTIGDQFRHTRESLGPIVDLALDGWRVVMVHGNGPQVGDELVRNEKARNEVAPLPLGVLVAGTAGWIGYMLQQSLENALRKAGNNRDVVTVLTQVEVAADDPALKDPKKFIGHGLSAMRARELRAQGHPVKKDGKGQLRRVVGSPKPLSIHELATIKTLLDRNSLVQIAVAEEEFDLPRSGSRTPGRRRRRRQGSGSGRAGKRAWRRVVPDSHRRRRRLYCVGHGRTTRDQLDDGE
jgi:carbamate kinase